MILASSVILSCCQTWGFLKEFSQKKDVHGLTLFHGSLRIAHCFSLELVPYFYLTGFDGICGVLTDEIEWHMLDSNLLQGQRLDPQVDTHVYELIRLYMLLFMSDFICWVMLLWHAIFSLSFFWVMFLWHAIFFF